jgi:phage baseplate assembly protein W
MNSDTLDGDEILGRGIAFPLRLTDGQLSMNSFENQVEQSMLLILRTNQGERVMRPTFGAGMERLAFEPMNAVTASLVQHQIQETLTLDEPRIEVLEVAVDIAGEAGAMLVHIQYRVKRTDSVRNLVYPFYVERGEA